MSPGQVRVSPERAGYWQPQSRRRKNKETGWWVLHCIHLIQNLILCSFYIITFAMQFITWLYGAHIAAELVFLVPKWMHRKWTFFFNGLSDVKRKKKDTKRHAVLSPVDISVDLFPSECPLPHLSFSQRASLPPPMKLRYGTGPCVFVYVCCRLFVCLLWSFQGNFLRGRYGRSPEPPGWAGGASHFCLQVHDLLAHQGNGGTGFLPLHRLQLQRRRRNCFQVLPHPGRWRVGLSYAFPRSLVGGLWLVLHTAGAEGGIIGVENGQKVKALSCFGAWLLFDLSALPAVRTLYAHTLIIQSHCYDTLWPMVSMQSVERLYQNYGKLKEQKKGIMSDYGDRSFLFGIFLPCYIKQTSLELGLKRNNSNPPKNWRLPSPFGLFLFLWLHKDTPAQ